MHSTTLYTLKTIIFDIIYHPRSYSTVLNYLGHKFEHFKIWPFWPGSSSGPSAWAWIRTLLIIMKSALLFHETVIFLAWAAIQSSKLSSKTLFPYFYAYKRMSSSFLVAVGKGAFLAFHWGISFHLNLSKQPQLRKKILF